MNTCNHCGRDLAEYPEGCTSDDCPGNPTLGMKTIKVSEAQGPVLDWAVAKAEGRRVELNHQYTDETRFDGWWQLGPGHWQPLNKYSTNWAQGGPIVERERIDVDYDPGEKMWIGHWFGSVEHAMAYGPTPLIAAMRCYVASKLGNVVEVPGVLA